MDPKDWKHYAPGAGRPTQSDRTWAHGLLPLLVGSPVPELPESHLVEKLTSSTELVHVPGEVGHARMPRPESTAPIDPPGPANDSLQAALMRLDPENDGHWTSQGLPRLDAVPGVYGLEIDRRTLNEVWPGFSRTVARKRAGGATVPRPEPGLSDAEVFQRGLDLQFRRRIERQRQAEREHAELGPFASRFPKPDLRCPLERRIAAENRAARRGY